MLKHSVAKSKIEREISRRVKDVRVYISAGKNASFLTLPSSLGGQKVIFTVPNYHLEGSWWHPTIRERVNNISSDSINFSLENGIDSPGLENGFARIRVTFQENGNEILGNFQGNIKNLYLTLELPLTTIDGIVTYNEQAMRASVDFRIEIPGLPQLLVEALSVYHHAFTAGVEEILLQIFEEPKIKQPISEAITLSAKELLGQDLVFLGIGVKNNRLFYEGQLKPTG